MTVPKTPTDSAKNVTGDSATFTELMRKLVSVPHSEIKAAMDEEQAVKAASGYAFRGRRAALKER